MGRVVRDVEDGEDDRLAEKRAGWGGYELHERGVLGK